MEVHIWKLFIYMTYFLDVTVSDESGSACGTISGGKQLYCPVTYHCCDASLHTCCEDGFTCLNSFCINLVFIIYIPSAIGVVIIFLLVAKAIRKRRMSGSINSDRRIPHKTENAEDASVYKYCKFILLGVQTFLERIRNKIIS